jgi:hypothetical protein
MLNERTFNLTLTRDEASLLMALLSKKMRLWEAENDDELEQSVYLLYERLSEIAIP